MNPTNNSIRPTSRSRLSQAFPTFRRLLSWRVLRVFVFALAALVTVGALVLAEENWRGWRAWRKCQRELEAKGEKLELSGFMPSAVPPEQNFAMTPFLVRAVADPQGTNLMSLDLNGSRDHPKMGSWQAAQPTDLEAWQTYFRSGDQYPRTAQPQTPAADVLLALSKYDASFQELHAASRRPHAVFPVNWLEGYTTPMTHCSVVRGLAETAALRATAFLADSQPDRALEDIRLGLRLADAVKRDPSLIAFLVRGALVQLTLQPVWEGLNQRRWTEAHLAALQEELLGVDLLNAQIRALRGERAFVNQCLALLIRGEYKASDLGDEFGLRWMPRGLVRQNQVKMNRIAQDVIDALQAATGPRGVYTPIDLSTYLDRKQRLERMTPYNILTRILLPSYGALARRTQFSQAAIDLALVACALERSRLAHDQYPDALTSLAPAFLERVPQDIMTGDALRYRRTDNGRFVIYSVGEDRKDDGGQAALTRNKRFIKRDKGDIVWRYARQEP